MKTPLILLIISIALLSCKQNEEITDYTANSKLIALTDTAKATPGDIVSVTFDAAPAKNTYNIGIAGKVVQLYQIEGTKYQFRVPEIPAGKAVIDLSAVGIKTPLSIEIMNYQVITNPAVVINNFTTDFNNAVSEIDAKMNDSIVYLSKADQDMIHSFKENIDKALSTLTDEQKKEVAYYLKNIDIKSTMSQANTANPKYIYSPLFRSPNDAGDKFMAIGKVFVTAVVGVAAGIAISIAGIAAPEPTPVTKVIGIIAGAGAAVSFLIAKEMLNKLSNEMGIQFSWSNLMSSNKVRAATADLELYNGMTKSVQFNAGFRALTISDSQSSSFFLKSIFSSITTLENTYNSFKSNIEKVSSWFPFGKPVLPPFVSPVKAHISSVITASPVDKLSFENISDKSISLSFAKNTTLNKVDITATGTEATADKYFTFDVVYKHPDLGIENRKTISARYVSVDSAAIYRQAVNGTWQVTNLESANASYTLTVTNDKCYYYIKDGANSNNGYYYVSISIYKYQNRYYMKDLNFWHPAYDMYRVYAPTTLPNIFLTYPPSMFIHYNNLGGGKGPAPAIRYQKN